jgi:hypothetical protein
MLVLLVFPFGIEKQFNLFGPTCFAFSNNPPPLRKEGEREREEGCLPLAYYL